MIEQLGQRLYSREEAAEILGISPHTIRLMTYDGRLEKVRIGRSVYLPEESLKAYLAGKVKTRPTQLTSLISDGTES